MAENSKIEWCDHTFNPWEGCTKVSPGCTNCYAEARDRRFTGGVHWGMGAPRRRTSVANWKLPLLWNNQVWRECRSCSTRWGGGDGSCPSCFKNECDHVRPRVFCASLADWLDDEVPIEWTYDLLDLIRRTQELDWLLLTKRPENFRPRLSHILSMMGNHLALPEAFTKTFISLMVDGGWDSSSYIAPEIGRENYLIGATVEDQPRADERIPLLLQIPAKVRFLSCEPLLGAVEFSDVTKRVDGVSALGKPALSGIHWVICGGESGQSARPMHPDWARSIRDQCTAAEVPFLFKQWGCFRPSNVLDFKPGAPGKMGWVRLDGSSYWADRPEVATDELMLLTSKAAAGRLLDDREHNEFPEVGR